MALRLPPGLADGFGLKGFALLAGARFTPISGFPGPGRIRQSRLRGSGRLVNDRL